MLTEDEIRRMIECLSYESVYVDGHIRVQKRVVGYSNDSEVGALQAKLSIMLEPVTHKSLAHGVQTKGL